MFTIIVNDADGILFPIGVNKLVEYVEVTHLHKILITRPLPSEIRHKANVLGDVTTRSKTTSMSEQEMISALQDYDIVVPTLGVFFSANIFL